MSPWRLRFSRLNNSHCLSLCSWEWCSSPLIILMTLLWTPEGPHPSYAGGSRLGHSIPGGVSQEWRKGGESPPLTCWSHFYGCSPKCRGPPLKLVSPDGIPAPWSVDHTMWHGIPGKCGEGATTDYVTNKDIKQHQSQYWPWQGVSLITDLDIELLSPTLWVQTSSLFFIHPSNPCVSGLETRMSCETVSNTLHKSRQMILDLWSSLIPPSTVTPPWKAHTFDGHGVHLVKPSWLSAATSFFMYIIFRRISSMISPGTEVRLTGQLLLWCWLSDGCTSLDVPLSPPPQGSMPQPQNYLLTL